jgi:hypothetical protein
VSQELTDAELAKWLRENVVHLFASWAYDGKFDQSFPDNLEAIAARLERPAVETHPYFDTTPCDEAWLSSVGFKVGDDALGDGCTAWRDGLHLYGCQGETSWSATWLGKDVRPIKTRGELRLLWNAVGNGELEPVTVNPAGPGGG